MCINDRLSKVPSVVGFSSKDWYKRRLNNSIISSSVLLSNPIRTVICLSFGVVCVLRIFNEGITRSYIRYLYISVLVCFCLIMITHKFSEVDFTKVVVTKDPLVCFPRITCHFDTIQEKLFYPSDNWPQNHPPDTPYPCTPTISVRNFRPDVLTVRNRQRRIQPGTTSAGVVTWET